MGPACFASPRTGKALSDGLEGDPSICQFQLTILPPVNHDNKPSSPGSVTTNGTSTTTSQSPKTPLRLANADAAFRRSIVAAPKVFVRMDDKHCFRLDMRQLETLELQVPTEKNDETTTQSPPCLLMMFQTCCFRIFSLKEDREGTQKELESAYHRLQACWERLSFQREGMVGVFPNDWTNSFGTSSGSSGGRGSSSNEAGQRNATTVATAGEQDKTPHDNPKVQEGEEDGKAVSLMLRKRQTCYAKSREGLQSLNKVLDMPAWIWERDDPKRRRLFSESNDDNDAPHVLREHLSDSLCSAADHLSASFWANRNEKHQVIQRHETEIQNYNDEMEQLLTEAFPRTHRGRFPAATTATSPEAINKRRQPPPSPPGCSHSTSSSPQAGTPAVTQDVNHGSAYLRRRWLLQAKETMKLQRQAIVDRHRLSLLPSRM